MMRSLFSGVSALQNHQVKMDVIGNNIANVNTIGYKAGKVNFQEAMSQTLRGAGGPQESRGGVNPQQVGLGMSIASIDTIHTQGNLQNTGGITHLAIEGDGMFVLGEGDDRYYSRAGIFGLDQDSNLVDPNGLYVMGWMGRNGVVDKSVSGLERIKISKDLSLPPQPTGNITLAGNLQSTTNGSLTFAPNPMTVSDDAGNTARLSIKLIPTGAFNEWNFEVTATGGTLKDSTGTITNLVQGTIKLDANGNVISSVNPFYVVPDGGTDDVQIDFDTSVTGGVFTSTTLGGTTTTIAAGQFEPAPTRSAPIEVYDSLGSKHDLSIRFTKIDDNQWHWAAEGPLGVNGSGDIFFTPSGQVSTISSNSQITFSPPGADPISILPDFSGLTQYASQASAEVVAQDGLPAGKLETFSINENGEIIGRFSNGQNSILGQIALATFRNPNGLMRAGESLFAETSNSGVPQIDEPGVGSRGTISPGRLEMSNVDLSQEFTDMIITQRGYQANSRVITTADQLLEELVNLKR